MRLEALDRLFESKYENEDSDSLFFRLVEVMEVVMTVCCVTPS